MEVGSVYKLDHSKLPKYVLGQLGHVRVVTVNERTKSKVCVSYPSKLSLEVFFGRDENGGVRKSTWLMQPDLDAVYAMNLNLAETVLCNRVSFEEFAARRGTRSFWVSDSPSEEVDSVNGGLGVVRWGLRKRATFVRKHRENHERSVSVEVEAVKEEDENEKSMEEEEEGGGRRGRKRKHPSKYVKKMKKNKKRGPVEIGMSTKKGDDFDNPTPETNLRWTKERYKKAEKSILKVMKAKEAYHGNPIFRADLRTEARNLIGDTGLLDHLLKHMAGKIAPGGKERFRRRHSPNGAMEYWLESADLVGIRLEAGVEDPYWIPPEGWKLGDSPTQDPVCARELKNLRGDVDKMKSEIQDLTNMKLGHEKSCLDDIPQSLDDDVEKTGRFLLMPLKAKQEDLLKRKAKIEEQLLKVAKALTDIEEDLGGLVVEANGKKRAEAAPSINEDAGEISSVERDKAEKKAARRQRLKSGFRTCKPDGTFLWPADMAESTPSFSTHLLIQVEDFLAVSSPSSVCSSKSPFPPPPLPPPQSAVLRPVAKKPSLGVSVSTGTRGWSGFSEVTKDKVGWGFGVASPTASSANSIFVPDLNEAPLLDGHTTNVDPPSVQKHGFSSSIQSTFPFHPSGGMIAVRAPIRRMIGSDLPLKNLKPSQATDQLLLLPSPATQVQRDEDVKCS